MYRELLCGGFVVGSEGKAGVSCVILGSLGLGIWGWGRLSVWVWFGMGMVVEGMVVMGG